jgi:hypothetical protein
MTVGSPAPPVSSTKILWGSKVTSDGDDDVEDEAVDAGEAEAEGVDAGEAEAEGSFGDDDGVGLLACLS